MYVVNAGLREAFVLGTWLVILAGASAFASLADQGVGSPTAQMIDFNIPAQPLNRALIAFGATAGFNLYDSAAFAEGRSSRDRPVTVLYVCPAASRMS
jgi:hypothetical protein